MHTPRRPRAEHVVLVSVDGLLPAYYLDPAWPAPAMRQLYRQGAHAVAVRSIFPSLTYPAHATLATGALPVRHGVHGDRAFEPVEDLERKATGRLTPQNFGNRLLAHDLRVAAMAAYLFEPLLGTWRTTAPAKPGYTRI